MPLYDDYRDQLKSEIADMMNTGGRPAGAITAALFLKEFTGGLPWAHLDIAGTAWAEEAKPLPAEGPDGVAVRTLAELRSSIRSVECEIPAHRQQASPAASSRHPASATLESFGAPQQTDQPVTGLIGVVLSASHATMISGVALARSACVRRPAPRSRSGSAS